jgi:hypothetical protein
MQRHSFDTSKYIVLGSLKKQGGVGNAASGAKREAVATRSKAKG